MRSFFRPSFVPLFVITAAVATLAVNRPASAILIKAGASTVFADNFENQTLGNAPATANTQTGIWRSTDASYTGDYTVVNSAVPGAAEGTQYLKASRPGGGVIIADFGAVSSGTVSASFSVYIPTGANDYVMQMGMGPVEDPSFGGIATAPVWLANVGNQVFMGNGAGDYTTTGVSITKGQWQTWTVDYTFVAGADNDTLKITVDASTATFTNAGSVNNIVDPANVRYLSFRLGDTGTFYVDAPVLPEPASLGVLGMGALFLARRRSR